MSKMDNNNPKNIAPMEITNLSEYLSWFAEHKPDSKALLHPQIKSYKVLNRDVNRYSIGLTSIGVKPGSISVVLMPLSYEFIVLTFTLLRVGAILVMIDPGMGPQAMAKALEGINADVFIGIYKAHLLKKLFPESFRNVKINIYTDRKVFSRGYNLKKLYSDSYDTFAPAIIGDNDIAAILFTSGSTGPPKGVEYTKSMLLTQIQYLKTYYGYYPGEIDLCTFPLIGLFSICLGLSTVIADMNHGKPATAKAKTLIKNINDFGVTHMFCSPMILNKIADYKKSDSEVEIPSMKFIISAGAPVHLKLLIDITKLLEADAEVHTPYGATEALPITDVSSREIFDTINITSTDRSGVFIGLPLKGLEIRTIEIDDGPLTYLNQIKLVRGTVGEIIVKGPVVSIAYHNLPEANKLSKIYDPENNETWHRMGDLGLIDDMGRIFFFGRKSQRVETESEILFTIPCEKIFNQHPAIKRSALVGISKYPYGAKIPIIYVEVKKEYRSKQRKKLRRELLDFASKYDMTRQIRHILFCSRFPVDPRHNAKIYREKLAKWAIKKVR